MTLHQLVTAVGLFSRNVHDPSLPMPLQTTSIRLLTNLVEGIYRKNSESDGETINVTSLAIALKLLIGKGRVLLVRILDTFVRKFGTMKASLPKIMMDVRSFFLV